MGVYSPYENGRVAAFGTWLGRPVDEAEFHVGRGSWSELESSSGDQLYNLLSPTNVPFINVCYPLHPSGASFDDVNSGSHDEDFRKMWRNIIYAVHPTSGKWKQPYVIARGGQESNGNFQPWKISYDGQSIDQTLAIKARTARQRIVTLCRQVETEAGLPNGFVLHDFCMAYRSPVNNPEWWYPGDQYTDIISSDFYQNSEYGDPLDATSFTYHRDDPRAGLAWLANFANNASARPTVSSDVPSGKLLWGIPELGVKSEGDNDTFAVPYFKGFRDFLIANGGAFFRYWDDNGDYASRVSDGSLTHIGAAVKTNFNKTTTNAPAFVSKYTGPTVPAYVPPAAGSNLLQNPTNFQDTAHWVQFSGGGAPAADQMSFSNGQVGGVGQTADMGFGGQGANEVYTITVTAKLISGTPGDLYGYMFDNYTDNKFPLGLDGLNVGESRTVTKTYASSGTAGGRAFSIRNEGGQAAVWQIAVSVVKQ
jgi:hypothetical protein